MDYLIDTNVLLRLVNRQDIQHSVAVNALLHLLSQGHSLHVTAQVLVEFWNVATRPTQANGFGWLPADAEKEAQNILSQFSLLQENSDIFQNWLNLVSSLGVQGKQVHDARLVAIMQTHQVKHLLTFNGQDFQRFNHIIVVDPSQLI